MNVRVIGGKYGGRVLDTPRGRTTHPMGERIRNALFNSLGDAVVGKTVLDAYAGTGAVGIEAMSRGAAQVTFVEKDKIAQKCIANNIQALAIPGATLVKASVSNWLDTAAAPQFDLVFADPPYHDTHVATIERLATVAVAPGGMLVLSWPEKQPAPALAGFTVVFDRVYAGARVVMYQNS